MPLKLAKKSVQDKSVFEILVEKWPKEQMKQIVSKLSELPEFKKMKLNQRKKALALLKD